MFGCSDLANQEYCILNKKYTPKERSQQVDRIIQNMQASGER
jgi:hypothetical protein